jgi:hypothetical protein
MLIPKKIHQIWFDWGKPQPSAKHQIYINELKILHPEWQYKLWGKEEARDFIKKHVPQYLDTYDDLPYNIQRCDLFRLIVLFKQGGFYFDIDIRPTRAIDDLCEYGVIIARQFVGGTLSNYFFGCKPEHPFILKIIKEIIAHHPLKRKGLTFWSRGHYIMVSTGPEMMQQVYERNLNLLSDAHILEPWQTSLSDRWGRTVTSAQRHSKVQWIDHRGSGMWFNLNVSEEPWLYFVFPVILLGGMATWLVIMAIIFGVRKNSPVYTTPNLRITQTLMVAANGVLCVCVALTSLFLLSVLICNFFPRHNKHRDNVLLAATMSISIAIFVPLGIILYINTALVRRGPQMQRTITSR